MGQCTNTVVFATVAALEICMKKSAFKQNATILSEQFLMECAYNYMGAEGCKSGPSLFTYMNWIAYSEKKLCTAANCPYKPPPKKTNCLSRRIPKVSTVPKDAFASNNSTEKVIKELVHVHSQVVVSLQFGPAAYQKFLKYKSGIFKGCAGDTTPENSPDIREHAAVIVGYGTEGGTDYWLLKNSMGVKWGEKGYFKLQRGVSMCKVDRSIGLYKCQYSSPGTFKFKAACEGDAEECDDVEGEEELSEDEQGDEQDVYEEDEEADEETGEEAADEEAVYEEK
jgi:hypothetical protein